MCVCTCLLICLQKESERAGNTPEESQGVHFLPLNVFLSVFLSPSLPCFPSHPSSSLSVMSLSICVISLCVSLCAYLSYAGLTPGQVPGEIPALAPDGTPTMMPILQPGVVPSVVPGERGPYFQPIVLPPPPTIITMPGFVPGHVPGIAPNGEPVLVPGHVPGGCRGVGCFPISLTVCGRVR